MANSLTRMPNQQVTDPAQQWFWNGSQWVCGCDGDDFPQFPPTAPPWFPPPPMQPPWYPGANGGVFFSTTAPQNPIRGAFWWDGSTLWLFDGAAWVDVGFGGASGQGGSGSGAGTVVISSTAPGNPATGSQWWDGSQLRMWNGSSWVVIGPGQSVGPVPTTTIVFAISSTSTKSLTPGDVWSIVPFSETPQADTMSAYDPITHKYKPTKPGMYDMTFRSGSTATAIVKNDSGSFNNAGGVDIVVAVDSQDPNTGAWINGSGISLMNGTTDFVRLWARDINGQFGNLGSNPCFSAILLP